MKLSERLRIKTDKTDGWRTARDLKCSLPFPPLKRSLSVVIVTHCLLSSPTIIITYSCRRRHSFLTSVHTINMNKLTHLSDRIFLPISPNPCDPQVLEVHTVVGIGKYAEDQTRRALGAAGMVDRVQVYPLLHPSPINPQVSSGLTISQTAITCCHLLFLVGYIIALI